jgi:hypothetical protein
MKSFAYCPTLGQTTKKMVSVPLGPNKQTNLNIDCNKPFCKLSRLQCRYHTSVSFYCCKAFLEMTSPPPLKFPETVHRGSV